MATLHFICGKEGAGKTTLARELGRTLSAVVICEDEWIDTLGSASAEGVTRWVGQQRRSREAVAARGIQLE
jgi:predicted kinase